MLQFVHGRDETHVWVNPRQVSAITKPQREGGGCTLLMSGGFEIPVRESAEEVAAQIAKRLNAY